MKNTPSIEDLPYLVRWEDYYQDHADQIKPFLKNKISMGTVMRLHRQLFLDEKAIYKTKYGIFVHKERFLPAFLKLTVEA